MILHMLHCLCRCFGLGLGPRACRRLLQGVAKLTGGTTEYLDDEERLQPKVSSTAIYWRQTEFRCYKYNNNLVVVVVV